MFALSSGRAGNFKKLGLAKVEPEVAATASSGRTLLEVVLPDGSSGEPALCRRLWNFTWNFMPSG